MAKTKVENTIEVISSATTNITPYIFSVDKITKTNCKLCQSEFREKAEEIYVSQKKKNYTAIQRTLKEEDDFEISAPSIRNHILYHYKAVENNVDLKEYTEDIQKWVNRQTNKVISLKTRIAILEREMFTIAQISEDLDIIERRKSAETIKKLADTILVYENKLKDFKEESNPINVVFNQLKIIVNDEMQHIDSVKTKKVLSTVLDRLKDSVGEVMVE